MPTSVVTVLLADDPLALNRAAGIVRRRGLGLLGLTWGPAARAGTARLVFTVTGDDGAVERFANQLRKMTEVRAVAVHPAAQCATREHALARVRVSPAQLSAVLDLLSLYDARIVEESPHDLVVEATGAAPFMVSFLRALEAFGLLDLARSSPLTLPPRPAVESAAPAPAPGAAPRVATAIPA